MPLNPEHILLPFAPAALSPDPGWCLLHTPMMKLPGMGGSLLKASKQGVETHVIVLTDGALGGERDNLVKIRQQEAEAAAQLLGLTSLACWTESDRGLEQSEGLADRIAVAINSLAPASVFFSWADGNPSGSPRRWLCGMGRFAAGISGKRDWATGHCL